MNKFSIYGHTVSKIGKDKNGDAFITENLTEEKLLLVIVSDGVSQQPQDWRASDTVVEEVSKNFKDLRHLKIENRISESIQLANKTILKIGNGMAATLSFFVWPYATSEFLIANIGDSRVYRITNEVECLTIDDSKMSQELVSSSKTTQLSQKSTLSKVMGQANIQTDITKHNIEQDELILVASDGFYGALPGTFNKKTLDLKGSENFEEAFRTTVRKFELFRGDDLTVVGLRT